MTCDAAALPLSKPALLGFRSSALSLVLVVLALLCARQVGWAFVFPAHLSPGPDTAPLSSLPFSHPATLLFTNLQHSASIGPSCVLDVSAYLSYLYLTHSC